MTKVIKFENFFEGHKIVQEFIPSMVPPKLILQQRDNYIFSSLIESFKSKSSLISGYHYSGVIYVVEYLKDNKFVYHTLDLLEYFRDNGGLISKDVGKMLKYATTKGKIQSSVTYYVEVQK